ncbi:MAG TPA: hypothetical protein VK157_05705 [Phycisphaerales bacterium]|nr:hypothetical protein [Phycisphaerales bacterium]
MTPTTSTSTSPVVQAWRNTTLGGKIAAALLLALVVLCAKPVYKAAEALLLPTPGEFVASGDDKKAAEAHAAAFDGYVKQLDGRSLWWTPSKPGTDATVVVEEDPQEGDAPPPAKYEGPAIAAIVLDSVWFADGSKLSATDDEKDGIKVVSTNAPWDAVIRYRGKEFTVPFFERDRVVFKDAAKTSSGADTRGNTANSTESSTTGTSSSGTKE